MPKIHRDRPPTNRYDVVVPEPEPETEPGPEAPQPPTQVDDPSPPPRAAGKAEWVAYAESVGIDASGTKAQIVERVRND